jgi:hypothetical protein
MTRRLAAFAVLLALALPLSAQRRPPAFGGAFGYGRNVPYDGRFTIVRLWYARYPGWSYDYPEMEQNVTNLLPAISALTPNPNGSNIMRMDDPELLKFPIAYLSEPGYWFPSESEVLGLRNYINKGGFLIVDDFHFAEEWAVFEAAMMRVLPDAKIERLSITHPIFNTFFKIKTLAVPYPGPLGERGLIGEFYGIHDLNHPSRRLKVVIDYNMDIGDYMEWSGQGVFLMDPTNEAFKFFINYLIYGLTR